MPPGGRRFGSGRKRVPVERKVLEGRFRPGLDGDLAPVEAGFPEAPAHLTEEERRLWAEFPRVPWIAASDGIAVEAAVSVYARLLEIRRTSVGQPVDVKLVTQEAALWGRLLAALSSLGLTPADRGKMTAAIPGLLSQSRRQAETEKADHDKATANRWAGLL